MNESVWTRRNTLKAYANRTLRPVEVILLVRYREAFSGRVLELGCGAGRVTGYMIELGGDVQGIDISPAMIEFCRRHYPRGRFAVADQRDLSAHADASLDLVFAGWNALDVLDDGERRAVLLEIRRILARDGVIIMSSHNRAYIPQLRGPLNILPSANPVRLAGRIALMPWRFYNHSRMRRLEQDEERYALVNDSAHDYRLLYYYVTRDDQAGQLEEAGFDLAECLDGEGRRVAAGEAAADSPELHYVARRN